MNIKRLNLSLSCRDKAVSVGFTVTNAPLWALMIERLWEHGGGQDTKDKAAPMFCTFCAV